MRAVRRFWRKKLRKLLSPKAFQERGSALIIVTLLLALLTIYVSASLTITTTDTVSSNFEVAQQRAYYTAFAKLEQMSRDFSSLFVTSTSPTYDSLCRVVLAPPDVLNNFRVVKPNVSCPPGSNCVPGYSGVDFNSSNLFDLGWIGQSNFCVIDVCNPSGSGCTVAPRPPYPVKIQSGTYEGLQAFARQYRQVSTVTNQVRGGANVQLTRDFTNFLLPLFQFGVFSDSDFELYIPPNWAFGGWVHTNQNFYLTGNQNASLTAGGDTISFSQYVANGNGVTKTAAKITVGKHMVIGEAKSGNPSESRPNSRLTVSTNNTGGIQRFNQGSVLGGAFINSTCNNVSTDNVSKDVPPGTTCVASSPMLGRVGGEAAPTIKIGASRLNLPIQNILNANPIQLIRRGLASDFDPARSSPYFSARYFYKPTIRVTLADYQAQLPRTVLPGDVSNPAAPTGDFGGVQLDAPDFVLGQLPRANPTGNPQVQVQGFPNGSPNWYYMLDATQGGNGYRPLPRGYQPKVVNPDDNTPRPTGARINGYRVHGWIKVEVVRANGVTQDITQEILNLGVTVPSSSNTTGPFYYPRITPSFPPTAYQTGPLGFGVGPFPDENSILHLQRFAVPYRPNPAPGITTAPPADLAAGLTPGLDTLPSDVVSDYYSNMVRRAYNRPTTSGLGMFGIEDNLDGPLPAGQYKNRNTVTGGIYAEPQHDQGGYYTGINPTNGTQILPSNALPGHIIDFSGNGNTSTTRQGTNNLGENLNTPKRRFNRPNPGDVPTVNDTESVTFVDGETTWILNDSTNARRRLVPFPINIFDSREGTPHEPNNSANGPTPVPGLTPFAVTKAGTMNLMEVDMGNLGRLLKGDFDDLFRQMGNTPYRIATGGALNAAALRDNIDVLQDNGWLFYVSDRRGDEPVLTTNQNKPGAGASAPNMADAVPTEGRISLIGDGEYQRENVVWSDGGNTASGTNAAVPRALGTGTGCTGDYLTDNKDEGKSPQDSNNDCVIQTESNGFSESAAYSSAFHSGGGTVTLEDQYDSGRNYGTSPNTTPRLGNMIALTQVPTNSVGQVTWTRKPPTTFNSNRNMQRIELFRRGVRLVNATNLFPTGPRIGTCGFPLGINVISENPVYVLGNYNAPAAEVNDLDPFPGIDGTPDDPTPATQYNGADFDTCGTNCHVPAAIVADAITLLSNPSVGTSVPAWGGANGYAGWLDSRTFTSPYQAIGYRPARNSAYRFALVSGYTPSWYPDFWTTATGTNVANIHQGSSSRYSSGAMNNFPRFLEDWGQNTTTASANPLIQSATYAGSLIRIYKSTQANGAFKRVNTASVAANFTTNNNVDYVYRPPNRDWIFDTDFNNPCTLPPGSPFLQLIDFKGFQQSQIQRPTN
ncbi:MAG: hypothetical protein J0M03_08860 [Acidobacteria bacterium]|nr:hypothetical protein [Acidobacteriota bacterium]